MCHCPDTPGAAQSCCALNRQDETGLASVQSVWGHLWKMEQSPAAAVPRVTTLSPILATSALLCPEHNPFMCTERHRKGGCDQRDSIHPSIPLMDRMENQPSTTHRRELCPPGLSLLQQGGIWGVDGEGKGSRASLQPACLSLSR